MQVGAEDEKRMLKTTGMVPMPTDSGLKAFYQGIVSDKPQVFVMEGQLQKMKQNCFPQDRKPSGTIRERRIRIKDKLENWKQP